MINKYQEFLTQKDLLARGWSKADIESVLVKPDFVMSYRGSSFSYISHLYDLETVARMEATNHMELGNELINERHDYVFWDDLYALGWTEKQLKTLLPEPTLIRNWDARSAQASYKVWRKNGMNGIAHELAFAVTKAELEKTLARRKKLAETKQAKLSATSAQLPSSRDLMAAIADNKPEHIFSFIANDNRVAVTLDIHKSEIIKAANELGFPTNCQSKRYKQHWSFSTAEARELFVIEVIDYLAALHGVAITDEVVFA